MTYSLGFDAHALKEGQKLGDTVRQQLKKKLATFLVNPCIEDNRPCSARLLQDQAA